MTRRNLTIQLDEAVVRRAKVLAAKRGTSVSALVAHEVERLTDEDQRYEDARERAARAMGRATERGGRKWVRNDLYDR